MFASALVLNPQVALKDVLPLVSAGAFVVTAGTFERYMAARCLGLELRDSILVLDKPLYPILICRVPGPSFLKAIANGAGALNLDACRVPHADIADLEHHREMVNRMREKGGVLGNSWKNASDLSGASEVSLKGRWPANALLSPRLKSELDEQGGVLTSGSVSPGSERKNRGGFSGPMPKYRRGYVAVEPKGTASRFFLNFEGPVEVRDYLLKLLGNNVLVM